jgi:hypothetical protein
MAPAAGTGSSGGNIRKRFFRQQLCCRKFLDRLAKCLSGLSPNHANAFTLREIEGADTGEPPGETLSEEAKERIRKSLRNP